MTGPEFARALGVEPQTVRRWEMDETRKSYREPSPQTVRLIGVLLESRAHSESHQPKIARI